MTGKAGILWVTSTPKSISPSTMNKWYIEEHIPDTINTSVFNSAFRYENITDSTVFKSASSKKDEFLSFYPVRDLKLLETPEYANIPVRSKTLGEGRAEKLCYDVISFGVRNYEFIDSFEGEKARTHPSPARLIISAAMQPPKSQEDDFNDWYRDEHYRTLSECKHYVRTRRYKLAKTIAPPGDEAPTFLTIHEFDCGPGELDAEGLGKSGATEWSQKIMGNLEKNETKVWGKMGGWGDIKAKF